MDELWELYSRIISEKGLNLQYDEKAETAFYNPETQVITIPIFNFVDEETTQMIVSHEIAHAKFSLYSQEELIEYSNKFQDLFNVVEDAYVERMMKMEFKGLQEVFKNGYKKLIKEGIFEVDGNELATYNLIERLAIYSKASHLFDVPFFGKENEFAYRITCLKSNEEVVQLCQDILDYINQNDGRHESPKFSQDEESQKASSQEIEDVENEFQEGSSSQPLNQENVQSEESSEGDEEEESDSEEAEENELINSIQRKFEANIETYGSEKKREMLFGYDTLVEVEQLNWKEVFDLSSLPVGKYYYKSKYAKNTIGMVKTLAKYADTLFKQKQSAYEMRNTRHKETGKLDMRKLAKYKTSMQIFRNVQILPEGKSHGIVMCIDFSGSMADRIGTVILQSAVLAEFCNMNKIPFEILGFGLSVENGRKMNYSTVVKVCNSQNYDLEALLYWGEMKNFHRFNKCYFRMVGTPTAEALILASDSLMQMKRMGIEKTCLFVITDGFHDSSCTTEKGTYDLNRVNRILWEGRITEIDSFIKHKRHGDWIVELLCSNIKRKYDTFISFTFLSGLDFSINSYNEDMRLELGITEKSSVCTYSIDCTEYFYAIKHAHYFKAPNLSKLIHDSRNLLTVNFPDNPFLDQFQNLDIDAVQKACQTQTLTTQLEYFKMLKLFVTNFISEMA